MPFIDYSILAATISGAAPRSKYSTDYLTPLTLLGLSKEERDSAILNIVQTVYCNNLVKSGEHRQKQWESGWGKNYDLYKDSNNFSALVPGYYNKFKFLRFDGDLFAASADEDEYNSVRMLMHYVFDTYLDNVKNIIEIGCGTGHHLCHLSTIDCSKNYIGLDWAESSQKILNLVSMRNANLNISGINFNFFSPPANISLPSASAIYSFAALEQIGDKHSLLLDYIIAQKPSLVVNIEPIAELLDDNDLLQFLSKEYFLKRNYLKGYLEELTKREKAGQIKILDSRRTKLGSYFIEGYSIVVWTVV